MSPMRDFGFALLTAAGAVILLHFGDLVPRRKSGELAYPSALMFVLLFGWAAGLWMQPLLGAPTPIIPIAVMGSLAALCLATMASGARRAASIHSLRARAIVPVWVLTPTFWAMMVLLGAAIVAGYAQDAVL